MSDTWRIWDAAFEYGEVLYRRAVGELPEMECSKAAAKILKSEISEGDRILDVGCGAGHYLRSYRKEIGDSFSYTGLDATRNYIELAKKAYPDDGAAEFVVGDAFDIGFPDNSFDIVVSNNLLLHLPSVKKPIEELCRVAKKRVIFRTLVGERTFVIREGCLHGDEFDESGELRKFNFYNIYSRDYIRHVLSGIEGVESVDISEDTQFDPKLIQQAGDEYEDAYDITTIMGKWQVNGYILQPWSFVRVALNGEEPA